MYEADSGGRHTSTSFIHFSVTFSFVLYEEMKRDRKKERGREIEGKRENNLGRCTPSSPSSHQLNKPGIEIFNSLFSRTFSSHNNSNNNDNKNKKYFISTHKQ